MRALRDEIQRLVPADVRHLCTPAASTLSVHGYSVEGDVRDHCPGCGDPLQAGSSCRGCRRPYRIVCANPGCMDWVEPTKHGGCWYFMQTVCSECRRRVDLVTKKGRLRRLPEPLLRRAADNEGGKCLPEQEVPASLVRKTLHGHPGAPSFLWLHGPAGVGKSHIVCREVVRAVMDGVVADVHWTTGLSLISTAKRQYMDDDDDRVTLQGYLSCELLVVDEALPGGRGEVPGMTAASRSCIAQLFEERINRGRLLIVTSRRSIAAITTQLSDQLGSMWGRDVASVSVSHAPGKVPGD